MTARTELCNRDAFAPILVVPAADFAFFQAGDSHGHASFFKQALDWQEQESRRAAAALLRQTIKDWTEWPGKKERKAEFQLWLGRCADAEPDHAAAVYPYRSI